MFKQTRLVKTLKRCCKRLKVKQSRTEIESKDIISRTGSDQY